MNIGLNFQVFLTEEVLTSEDFKKISVLKSQRETMPPMFFKGRAPFSAASAKQAQQKALPNAGIKLIQGSADDVLRVAKAVNIFTKKLLQACVHNVPSFNKSPVNERLQMAIRLSHNLGCLRSNLQNNTQLINSQEHEKLSAYNKIKQRREILLGQLEERINFYDRAIVAAVHEETRRFVDALLPSSTLASLFSFIEAKTAGINPVLAMKLRKHIQSMCLPRLIDATIKRIRISAFLQLPESIELVAEKLRFKKSEVEAMQQGLKEVQVKALAEMSKECHAKVMSHEEFNKGLHEREADYFSRFIAQEMCRGNEADVKIVGHKLYNVLGLLLQFENDLKNFHSNSTPYSRRRVIQELLNDHPERPLAKKINAERAFYLCHHLNFKLNPLAKALINRLIASLPQLLVLAEKQIDLQIEQFKKEKQKYFQSYSLERAVFDNTNRFREAYESTVIQQQQQAVINAEMFIKEWAGKIKNISISLETPLRLFAHLDYLIEKLSDEQKKQCHQKLFAAIHQPFYAALLGQLNADKFILPELLVEGFKVLGIDHLYLESIFKASKASLVKQLQVMMNAAVPLTGEQIMQTICDHIVEMLIQHPMLKFGKDQLQPSDDVKTRMTRVLKDLCTFQVRIQKFIEDAQIAAKMKYTQEILESNKYGKNVQEREKYAHYVMSLEFSRSIQEISIQLFRKQVMDILLSLLKDQSEAQFESNQKLIQQVMDAILEQLMMPKYAELLLVELQTLEWSNKQHPNLVFEYCQQDFGEDVIPGGICHGITYRWMRAQILQPTKPITKTTDLVIDKEIEQKQKVYDAMNLGLSEEGKLLIRDRMVQALYKHGRRVDNLKSESLPAAILTRDGMSQIKFSKTWDNVKKLIGAIVQSDRNKQIKLQLSSGCVGVLTSNAMYAHTIALRIDHKNGIYAFADPDRGYFKFSTIEQLQHRFSSFLKSFYPGEYAWTEYVIYQYVKKEDKQAALLSKA